MAKKEHLEQSLSRQSQQLSEVRQKVKQRQSVSCKEEEELKTQLSTAQEAKQRLQEVEVKVRVHIWMVRACMYVCMYVRCYTCITHA